MDERLARAVALDQDHFTITLKGGVDFFTLLGRGKLIDVDEQSQGTARVGQIHPAVVARAPMAIMMLFAEQLIGALAGSVQIFLLAGNLVKRQPSHNDEHPRTVSNVRPGRSRLGKFRELSAPRFDTINPMVSRRRTFVGRNVKPDFQKITLRMLGKANLSQVTCPPPSTEPGLAP